MGFDPVLESNRLQPQVDAGLINLEHEHGPDCGHLPTQGLDTKTNSVLADADSLSFGGVEAEHQHGPDCGHLPTQGLDTKTNSVFADADSLSFGGAEAEHQHGPDCGHLPTQGLDTKTNSVLADADSLSFGGVEAEHQHGPDCGHLPTQGLDTKTNSVLADADSLSFGGVEAEHQHGPGCGHLPTEGLDTKTNSVLADADSLSFGGVEAEHQHGPDCGHLPTQGLDTKTNSVLADADSLSFGGVEHRQTVARNINLDNNQIRDENIANITFSERDTVIIDSSSTVTRLAYELSAISNVILAVGSQEVNNSVIDRLLVTTIGNTPYAQNNSAVEQHTDNINVELVNEIAARLIQNPEVLEKPRVIIKALQAIKKNDLDRNMKNVPQVKLGIAREKKRELVIPNETKPSRATVRQRQTEKVVSLQTGLRGREIHRTVRQAEEISSYKVPILNKVKSRINLSKALQVYSSLTKSIKKIKVPLQQAKTKQTKLKSTITIKGNKKTDFLLSKQAQVKERSLLGKQKDPRGDIKAKGLISKSNRVNNLRSKNGSRVQSITQALYKSAVISIYGRISKILQLPKVKSPDLRKRHNPKERSLLGKQKDLRGDIKAKGLISKSNRVNNLRSKNGSRVQSITQALYKSAVISIYGRISKILQLPKVKSPDLRKRHNANKVKIDQRNLRKESKFKTKFPTSKVISKIALFRKQIYMRTLVNILNKIIEFIRKYFSSDFTNLLFGQYLLNLKNKRKIKKNNMSQIYYSTISELDNTNIQTELSIDQTQVAAEKIAKAMFLLSKYSSASRRKSL